MTVISEVHPKEYKEARTVARMFYMMGEKKKKKKHDYFPHKYPMNRKAQLHAHAAQLN